MLAVLLTMVVAVPAHALLCGDGVVDELLLEQCDDGNNLPGDCCSPLCQIEDQGTVCRAATGTCDPEEVCDGVSDVCPVDVVIPDADGDTVCDPADLCPAVPDPAQLDLDEDAIGDACDPCINVGGVELVKTKLTLSKLDVPEGDDRVRLKGMMQLPPGPDVDPILNGIRLLITDGSGIALVDATVPGGAFNPNSKTGWRANGGRSVFSFKSPGGNPALSGIQRVILKGNPFAPGALRILLIGRDGIYPKPETAPITVMINVTQNTPGQCAEAKFNAVEFGPKCTALNGGARFLCR